MSRTFTILTPYIDYVRINLKIGKKNEKCRISDGFHGRNFNGL
jgi:hypothetical protein